MAMASAEQPQPSVTIGITAYNAADTIGDAIRSALAQTVRPAQIVIVDDCSTDGTWDVLQGFAGEPGIDLYRCPQNRGVGATRNEVLARARGEFIVFFDDDDVSAPTRVAAQIARIIDYERRFTQGTPVICHTARLQVFPDGTRRVEPTMGCAPDRAAPAGPAVARRTLMGEPLADAYGSCATCSQAGRTSVYRALGGFDAALRRCEDMDLAIRLARVGGHFAGICEPLVTQRMTATTDKALADLRELTLMVYRKHRDLFDDERSYRFCLDWVRLKFRWLAGQRLGFATLLSRLAITYPVRTFRRFRFAIPNLSHNIAFARFLRGVR